MKQRRGEITTRTTSGTDVIDITEKAQAFVSKSNITNGLFTASVPGSTASISTIEFESGAVNDLKEAIERIAPKGMDYQHDARWGDGNGYSHVRAALMKPSLSVPVEGGRIALGTWQQLVLMDFDNRSRNRKVNLHVIGD